MGKDHRSDILFFFVVLLSLWAAYAMRDVLLLIYVSALFAVVVSPAVSVVRRLKINGWRPGRGFAIVVLMAALILGITIFFIFALPPVYRNVREFAAEWPKHLSELNQRLRGLPFSDQINPTELEKYGAEIIGGAAGLFRNVAGGIFGLFTGIILTAYFIIDGVRAFHWSVSLFPIQHQSRLAATLLRAEVRMRKWLVGQGLLMLSLGICSFVVYYALGLRYFYVLAIYSFVANIVPVVGPLSAAALACTVAAFDSGHKVIGVMIFYAVYQQLESAVLSPRIMKSTVDLSPLAVIIALVLGGALAGVLGALVSVPTAALVSVFVEEYLVKRKSVAVAAS
jgi:predicted PurR-regulated permease PerM